MLMLNDEIKAQLEKLSERVSRYDKQIRKFIGPILSLGGVVIVCAVIQYFLTPDLSSIHIPASLLAGEGLPNDSGIESPTAALFLDLSKLISTLSPIMTGLSLIAAVAAAYIGLVKERGVSGMLMWLVMSASFFMAPQLLGDAGDLESRYDDHEMVSAIINHDMSEPIDQGYIAKAQGLDERYLLAQAAVLSQAHYPTDFFKSVADELTTGAKGLFEPEFDAQYAIEVAAYGHLVTPQVVDQASSLSFYSSIAKTIALFGIGGLGALVVGVLGLSTIRMSIKRRLNAIDAMIKGHGVINGAESSLRIQDTSAATDQILSPGNLVQQCDALETKEPI